MRKFEYKVVELEIPRFLDSGTIRISEYQRKLNRLGSKGWELISIDFGKSLLYFKRLVEDD